MMNLKIGLVPVLLLLILGSASAVYELCDSIERVPDGNRFTFKCTITSTQYRFSQQEIDGFWENMKTDGDYTHDRLSTVEWKMKSTVLQVADDLRFVQGEGMNLAWDIILEGDTNTTHDINSSLVGTIPRPTNHTAIKKRIGAMQEYLISIAPFGERRSVRNITLTRPSGALAVYISGSHLKRMIVDIEGSLRLTGAYMENLESLKAKSIVLTNGAYLLKAESIEAESISLDNVSYIRRTGGYGQTAIKVTGTGGLHLEGNSYIEEITGNIEVESGITLEGNSRIENLGYAPSEVIQNVKAGSIEISEGSKLRGLAQPGEITVTGLISVDNGQIIGRQGQGAKSLTAGSLSLLNGALLQNFSEGINVIGTEKFDLASGASIRELSGTVNSCAPITLDGNSTKISFTSGSEKTIRARSLSLDNNAKIVCAGQEDCDYQFVERACGEKPTASLDIVGQATGPTPLNIEFFGECTGSAITECTIDFGDGTDPTAFDGNISHTYNIAGAFNPMLTAKNQDAQSSTAQKAVIATSGPAPLAVLQATASKQTVSKGEEISLEIECDGNFQSFSVQNNFGLPAITTAPETCPAVLGPFKIPDTVSAGTYSFTVSGIFESGQPFSQTASFTVEEPPGIFEGLSDMLPFGGLLVVVVIIIVAVLAFLVIQKKRGKMPFGEPGAAKPPETAKPAQPAAAQKPAAKTVSAPAPKAAAGGKPPWMVQSGEEVAKPAAAKPVAAKPAAPKPAVKPVPAPKAKPVPVKKAGPAPKAKPVPVKKAGPVEKPAAEKKKGFSLPFFGKKKGGFSLPFFGKKKGAEKPVAQTTGPAAQRGQGPAAKGQTAAKPAAGAKQKNFNEFVSEIRQVEEGGSAKPAEPAAKKPLAPSAKPAGPAQKQPAAAKPGLADQAPAAPGAAKPEKKAGPGKKFQDLARMLKLSKGSSQKGEIPVAKSQAPEAQKPAETAEPVQKPAPVPAEKPAPAPVQEQKPEPVQKPAAQAPVPAVKPAAQAEKPAPVQGQEKPKAGFLSRFRKKKKPVEKEEPVQEQSQDLPPWLRKEGE